MTTATANHWANLFGLIDTYNDPREVKVYMYADDCLAAGTFTTGMGDGYQSVAHYAFTLDWCGQIKVDLISVEEAA